MSGFNQISFCIFPGLTPILLHHFIDFEAPKSTNTFTWVFLEQVALTDDENV